MKPNANSRSWRGPGDPAAMTIDAVVKQLRQEPELRDFVKKCYLDEDLLEAARRFYASEEFEAVRELARRHGLGEPGFVLDLGGGHGVASLAWQMAGHRVILADPNRGDVAGLGAIRTVAEKSARHVGLLGAVGERLPFRDGTFHLVYGRQVLHHVYDLDAVCTEAHRVLAPGGTFLATREHVISKPEDLERFLENHATHRYTRNENARLVSAYTGALRRAGFRKVKVIGSWQSVINYYPETRESFANLCRRALARRLGARLSRYLGVWQFLLPYCGWYLTKRDQVPGRMYSFVAVR